MSLDRQWRFWREQRSEKKKGMEKIRGVRLVFVRDWPHDLLTLGGSRLQRAVPFPLRPLTRHFIDGMVDATALYDQLLRRLGPSDHAPLPLDRSIALRFQVVQLAKGLKGWTGQIVVGEKDTRGMLARIASLDADMDKYEDPILLVCPVSFN